MKVIKNNTVSENRSSWLLSISRKKDFFILSGIILIALIFILLQHFMEPEMGRDASLYLLLIEKWSGGGFAGVLKYWPDFWIPPLLLCGATLLTHIGLSPESAALTICMGCGILMPLVSFGISHELSRDKRISLVAAFLTAINPSIIEMSVQVQRDVPYLFVAGWCIYLIIAGIRRDKWYWWCGAGCTWGLSLLIRFEMIEFLLLLGMYFIFAFWNDRKKWFTYFRNLIIFVLCGITVMIAVLYTSGTEKVILSGYKNRILHHLQQFNVSGDREVQK